MKWKEFKILLEKQADVTPSLSGSLLNLWAAARQLSDLADCSFKQGQLEQAYVFYLRTANTLILHARKHKDFPSASASSKNEYKALAGKSIEQLEKLAAILQEKWDALTPAHEPDCDQDEEEQPSRPQVDQHPIMQNSIPLPQASDSSSTEFPSAPSAEDVLQPPISPPYLSSFLQSGESPSKLLIPPKEFNPFTSVAITPDATSNLADPFANLRMSDIGRRQEPHGGANTARKQISILEGLSAVKRLFMPSDLPWVFLRHVEQNTSKNIETCGFLLGRLSPNDDFVATELYIPPQTGTEDTVNVGSEGDEATLSYAVSNNLCILGWIHTHPSQACFLSSVDLHTQFIYQATQSSFVGIVMAPSYPNNNIGFFSVTKKGLSILRNCSKDGFHHHSENEGLYTVSKHVVLDDKRRTKVVDGR